MEESWLGSALPYLFFFGLVLIIAVMTLFTVQQVQAGGPDNGEQNA